MENSGRFKKGFTPWNKGLKGYKLHSEDTKRRISDKLKGKKQYIWTEIQRKNASIRLKGKPPSNKGTGKPEWHVKLTALIRKRILKSLGRKKNRKSRMEFLGCSIEDLKTHLERKFKDGMDWNNHGLRGWHIDHIKPLDSFNLKDPIQVKEAFSYKNLQPLWARENLVKSNKITP